MDRDEGKVFIGGISWDTTEETLTDYFSKYGNVSQTVIMRDKVTGRPRGFGFVVFSDPSVLDSVLQDRHTIEGRTVEAKRALSREEQQTSRPGSNVGGSSGGAGSYRTKKIFVGGLPATLTEEEFRQYFESYGDVTDVVIMFDQNTQRPRGFGFITFDTEDAVDRVLQKTFHELNNKAVEVKRALPKDATPGGGGGRGGYQGNNSSGSFDRQMDGNRFVQQSAGGGYPPCSGYGQPSYGFGGPNPNAGYGGYGSYGVGGYGSGNAGYGGPAGAYPSGVNFGYLGGNPGALKSAWGGQSPGYGSLGYGPNVGYGNNVSAPSQSATGASGYGSQAYGYGNYGSNDGYNNRSQLPNLPPQQNTRNQMPQGNQYPQQNTRNQRGYQSQPQEGNHRNQYRPPGYQNQFQPQQNRNIVPAVVPIRWDLHNGRQLVIDPSGRACLLSHGLQRYHWVTQLGSDIVVAEHNGTEDYIDFSHDDPYNQHLYHYSEIGKEQIIFPLSSLRSTTKNNYDILNGVLAKYYPNDDLKVMEVKRTPFCVNFEDGTTILDSKDHMDYMTVTRLDLKIQHKSWFLLFSIFEANTPCLCGALDHKLISVNIDCSRPCCLVATARTYEQFERLTNPIYVPLPPIIVYRHKREEIGTMTVYEAILDGSLIAIAEEVNVDLNLVAYGKHQLLNTAPYFLHYYGPRAFHNCQYHLFSYYEENLYHLISVDKMKNIPSFKDWARDIVNGLIWLHSNGLHHGSVRPQNIVLVGHRALLHRMTRDGSQADDVVCLGALFFHMFTRGAFFEKSEYIPTLDFCDLHLLKSDPEANDLVKGLISGRISLNDVMDQPRWWSVPIRLEFIQLVSDHVYNHQLLPVPSLLESTLQQIEKDVYAKFSDPKFKGMDLYFVRHADERVWHYGADRKVAALLRSFRNIIIHIFNNLNYRDQSEKLHHKIKKTYPDLVLLIHRHMPPQIWDEDEFKNLMLKIRG